MIDFLVSLGVSEKSAGDVWLLIIFVMAGVVLMTFVKRRNLGGFLISAYIAYVVSDKTTLSFFSSPVAKTAYFLAILFLIFIFFKKLFKISITGKKLAVWFKASIFSFAIVGFLTSVVLDWHSKSELADSFSLLSLQIFRSSEGQFLWAIVPLFLVMVFKYRQ